MTQHPLLCALDDIPDGTARGFCPPVSGVYPIFAIRRGPMVWLYRDECPHQGAPLAWRQHEYLSDDAQQIVCFAHGARFEIATGVCTVGPCIGQRLEQVPHEIDGEGNIRLRGRDVEA
jgi:nitrite reductase/ring-hydroxylating ferredoxin subunit